MYQIDNSTAASTQPASTTPGTPGWFTDGSAGGGVAPTIVPAEWLNAVQAELCNAITSQGIALSKSAFNQLAAAIKKAGTGRLLGVTVITASGSFTPNPLANTTVVEGSGAGGAGGGTVATTSSTISVGTGGSSGAYAKILISGAIAGPVTCAIGAGGTGVSGASGNAGGTTSFGTYLSCPGGAGGLASTATAPPFIGTGSGSNSAPTINGAATILSLSGAAGGGAFGLALNSSGFTGGRGNNNPLGIAPNGGYGTGGSGNAVGASAAAGAGLAGLPGVLIITEYA